MTQAIIAYSARVEDRWAVGCGTVVWNGTAVFRGVRIGARCSIGRNCIIGPNVTIRRGTRIQDGALVYEGVSIDQNVFIGPGVVFTNVEIPRAFIKRHDRFLKTRLGEGCSIGANATIVCGVTIGKYAMIGAGAVVTKDVPAYALVTGTPARQAGWVSRAGNKLSFDEQGAARDEEDNTKYGLRLTKGKEGNVARVIQTHGKEGT